MVSQKRLRINRRFKKMFKAIKRFKIVRDKEIIRNVLHKKRRIEGKLVEVGDQDSPLNVSQR